MIIVELILGASLTSHLVKSLFATGSVIAPALTGSMAFRLFNKPWPAQALSEHERDMAVIARKKLAQANRFRVSCGMLDVQAYHFPRKDQKGTIILVHGWTSEASHMMGLVTPLMDEGFSVVSFDFPAHGLSRGNTTNIVECAKVLQCVASLFADIHGVVAHSFGGPVTALALKGIASNEPSFDVRKIALIACPNESAYVTRIFGDTIGLKPQAQTGFEAAFEALCECPLEHFTGSNYFSRIDRPMLVLHGDSDSEIPHAHGLKYGELKQCEFVSLEKIGHRDILYAPEVGERIGHFMVS
jgi:pimeloyl-ACP methyl ester carboxylesterase